MKLALKHDEITQKYNPLRSTSVDKPLEQRRSVSVLTWPSWWHLKQIRPLPIARGSIPFGLARQSLE